MTLRLLKQADIPAAKRLWHICFPEDSEAFIDWFFRFRFPQGLSVGCFEEDRLLSALYGTLMPLSCMNEAISALMVSGVSTEPRERGKGYMHASMLFLKETAAKRGIHILFNHPQKPDTYKRLGYLPCTDTLYFEQPAAFFTEEAYPSLCSVHFSESVALKLYQSFAAKYSACTIRDKRAFSLRTAELTLDGGEAFLFTRGDEPVAYCFCHREGSTTIADETVSLSAYGPVLATVCRLTGAANLCAKLPPDTPLPGEKRVQNIMLTGKAIYTAFDYGKKPCYSPDEY